MRKRCAAAAFMAALKHRDPSALSPSAQDVYPRIAGAPDQHDIDRARAVLERILSDSELADAFAESDAEDDWRAAMQSLLNRLA